LGLVEENSLPRTPHPGPHPHVLGVSWPHPGRSRGDHLTTQLVDVV
jgi:hypothetical protein